MMVRSRSAGKLRKLVNSDPYGAGWMIRMRVTDKNELDALLGADAYTKQIGG